MLLLKVSLNCDSVFSVKQPSIFQMFSVLKVFLKYNSTAL